MIPLLGKIRFLLLFLLFSGCISRPLPPLEKKVSPVTKKGLPLEGRVIVVDPGHGGRWRGAIGKNGFEEAEINLGVALYLYGFLKEQGAEVILTRTTDREVAQGEQIALKDDLQARCEIANQAQADLFISIHHNSDQKNPQHNEIQVYYQMRDPGPSFDLAIEIGVALFDVLGQRDTDICPGNYYVLRNTKCIAILGEAAFLSNEVDEKRLAYFRSLREEAYAYYQGILNYLNKGIPHISNLIPEEEVLQNSPPEISGFIRDEQGIDPSTIRMTLDGREVNFNFDPLTGKVSYIPLKPLSNSLHTFRIEGRNLAGNAARPGLRTFILNSPPELMRISLFKEDIPGIREVLLEVLDRNSQPVFDGTPIEVYSERGKIFPPQLILNKGKARAFLLADRYTGLTWIRAHAGEISGYEKVSISPPSHSLLIFWVKNTRGKPVESAEVSIEGKKVYTDSSGYAIVELSREGQEKKDAIVSISRPGYRSVSFIIEKKSRAINTYEITLKSEDEGLLVQKTIILDPEILLKKRDLETQNLESMNLLRIYLVNELKERLEAAGATCYLTTEISPKPTIIERILFASDKKGDYFINLKNQEEGGSIGYYFNSEAGKKLASCIRNSLVSMLGIPCRTNESGDFVVIHTEMPAVVVALPYFSQSGKDEGNEKLLRVSAAIYKGLLNFLKQSN